jgi:2-methylcitrate dehydratase
VALDDGTVIEDELLVADAHPNGARPFSRSDYLAKFAMLTEDKLDPGEARRFLDVVQRVSSLDGEGFGALGLRCLPGLIDQTPVAGGIF